jgi:hypothetical protein
VVSSCQIRIGVYAGRVADPAGPCGCEQRRGCDTIPRRRDREPTGEGRGSLAGVRTRERAIREALFAALDWAPGDLEPLTSRSARWGEIHGVLTDKGSASCRPGRSFALHGHRREPQPDRTTGGPGMLAFTLFGSVPNLFSTSGPRAANHRRARSTRSVTP